MGLLIKGITGDIDFPPTVVDLSLSLEQLRINYVGASIETSGIMDMRFEQPNYSVIRFNSTSNIQQRIRGTEVDGLYIQRNLRMNLEIFNSGRAILSVNGSVQVPALVNLPLNVATTVPFVINNGTDYATGRMTIKAPSGPVIRLSADGSASALIELDTNSDGLYDQSQRVPWDSF